MSPARLVDVAAAAGVSIKTVSNVVNAHPHVADATRSRVQAAIDDLGYRPHAVGRQLRTGRTGIVSLALPEIDTPYFAELAAHLVNVAADHGLVVVVEQTGGRLDAERRLVDAREAGTVDGLVMSPVATSAEELARRALRTPLVLLGEGARPPAVDHVGMDDVAAARGACEHLLGLGRRRVAFLGGGGEHGGLVDTSRMRHSGWADALAAAGLAPGDDAWLEVPSFSAADGDRAVTQALAAGTVFDALLCTSDLLALGALHALRRAGRSVPQDVAVVGWDDVAFAAWTAPPLTTVRRDGRRIAEHALALLTERISGRAATGGRHVVVSHELVVRDTCGARAPGGSPRPPQDQAL